VEQASSALPKPPAEQYIEPFEHGTLRIGLYAPRGHDPQEPHAQDEVYVVLEGSGWFVNGPSRHRFAAGDVLFVPAGTLHRFEEFTDDFQTWVIFYGPPGGEHPA
jgi:mannose-6-phosphate isomerase-like protein (cupin superfamily)